MLAVAGLLVLGPAAVMAQDASGSPAPAASVAPIPENPYNGAIEGSGVGKTIGYMSLAEYIPFVNLVTQGIQAEVAKSGATLVFCDTNLDPATTLACAQQMKTGGAQGVINFQINQAQSPEFCAAYDNVTTIAIDIVQPPCETLFFGANNHEAGRLAGAGMGKYAKDNWNCQYDAYVSLESVGAGDANAARMGGMRDGFKEYCPIINETIRPDDDRTDKALKGMTELLPTCRVIGSSSPPSTRTACWARWARRPRSAARLTCSTPVRAPTSRSGRMSPATRSTSRPWPTSRRSTARRSCPR